MAQQHRYAFVCPRLETITVTYNGEKKRLETSNIDELKQMSSIAIDAAMESNIAISLFDRSSERKIEFSKLFDA